MPICVCSAEGHLRTPDIYQKTLCLIPSLDLQAIRRLRVPVLFLWQKGQCRTATPDPRILASMSPENQTFKEKMYLHITVTGSLHKARSYHKEAQLLILKQIGAQGQMISKVWAKTISDKSWDYTLGCGFKTVAATAVRRAIVWLMAKLTAALCADKRYMTTTNMHTPPNEISCWGRCLVSRTSHTTSRATATTSKTLKAQLNAVSLVNSFHEVQLFIVLRRVGGHDKENVLSPIDPFWVGRQESDGGCETLADSFALVLLHKFVCRSSNDQTRQDHERCGPLEI